MKKLILTEKNHEKRYGNKCSECNGKLGKVFTQGHLNGKSLRFCSFNCQDSYMDKNGGVVNDENI